MQTKMETSKQTSKQTEPWNIILMNTAEKSSKPKCDSKWNWALHFKKLLLFLGRIEVVYCNVYKKGCGLILVYEWSLLLRVYFLVVWFTRNEFCDYFITGILVHFSEVLNGLSVSHKNKLRAKEWNIYFWAHIFFLCTQIFSFSCEIGVGGVNFHLLECNRS